MLLVVFGAGASYDSIPSCPLGTWVDLRPPLANQLFENRPIFTDALSHFPRCQAIVPYLQSSGGSVQVERELERLQGEADTDPERHRQLASVRFYLRLALYQCQRRWTELAKGVTTYKTLLDQIRHHRKPSQKVCLVTFNYDTLLEEALPSVGVNINGIEDYVSNADYMLIKIHGSIDWGREVGTPLTTNETESIWHAVDELVTRAAELHITQKYHRVVEQPIGRVAGRALFPAIAIPLELKRDFECPPAHIEFLTRMLPQVTKLLIIGWRGMDAPFLDLLKENLNPEVRAYVVAGNEKEVRGLVDKLNGEGIHVPQFFLGNGFTEFVVQRDGEEFFKS